MADLALAVLLDDGDGIRVGLYAETGPSRFSLAGALRLKVECLGGVQPIEGTDIDEGAAFPARSATGKFGTTCGCVGRTAMQRLALHGNKKCDGAVQHGQKAGGLVEESVHEEVVDKRIGLVTGHEYRTGHGTVVQRIQETKVEQI